MHSWFMRNIVIPFADHQTVKKRCRVIYDRVESDPYLIRFYLLPRWMTLGLCRVVLHRFVRSDSPLDGTHDHPWPYCSIVLSGGYWEHTAEGRKFYKPGSMLFRKATHLHRIELIDTGEPVYTLFIMGPKVRSWGFFVNGKWHPWRDWIAYRKAMK